MTKKNIDAKTLKKWLTADEVVLVDVREPSEYAEGHIKGSVNLPVDQVSKSTLPKIAKGKKLVMQCKLGKRGMTACDKLASEDPKLTVYNLEGGIDAWKKAKFPVEGGSCTMSHCHTSMENQVRIAVGGFVVLGILLGYALSDMFYLITALLGVAYIISGITNNCMLAKILADMPWNNPENCTAKKKR